MRALPAPVASTRSGANPPRSDDTAPRRVLLVEDDAALRESLADGLTVRGYQVDSVVHGLAALEHMRRFEPDLVVLDLMMPVMDGWQFRAQQKRDPALAAIPVIVLSGNQSAAAVAVDAQLCLHKPLEADALVQAIEGVLASEARRRQPAQAAQSERLAALGTLAAGMAHEINNPLTYVLLHLARASQLLRRSEGAPVAADRLVPLIDGALEGAERIRTIASGMRAFARVDEDSRVPVDLRQVIESSVRLLAHQIRLRARLVCEHREAPPVLASGGRLGQVVINLLSNAIQALPEGNASAHEIRIASGSDERGWAVVEVSDDGCGIPEHLQARIFEPFFTTKPVGDGTGLGLAISHGIVRSLGGTIELESAVGAGTRVTLSLPPLAASPRRVRAGADRAELPRAERRRILVVDDEPAVLSAIEGLLEDAHEVVTAESGRAALDLLASGAAFDLILCDLHMPEVAGMQLYQTLSASHPEQADRIVFMTGGAFTESSRRFLAARPGPVLQKPIDLDSLLTLLADPR
jgi:signal transduction histidine kinase